MCPSPHLEELGGLLGLKRYLEGLGQCYEQILNSTRLFRFWVNRADFDQL